MEGHGMYSWLSLLEPEVLQVAVVKILKNLVDEGWDAHLSSERYY